MHAIPSPTRGADCAPLRAPSLRRRYGPWAAAALAGAASLGPGCGYRAPRVVTRAEILRALPPLPPNTGYLWGEAAQASGMTLRGRPPGAGALSWREIARRSRTAAPSHGAEAFRDHALVDLGEGRLAAAIEGFAASTRLAPRDPGLWNDLAVAHLARARLEPAEGCHERVLALEAAARSAALAPRSAEGLFNLGLALADLGLDRESARAWRAYLELPGPVPARSFVADRVEKLAAAAEAPPPFGDPQQAIEAAPASWLDFVSARPEAARALAQEDLLGQWAQDRSTGETGRAAHQLKAALQIGWLLAARSGDLTIVDAAATAAHHAAAPGDPAVVGHACLYRGTLAERSDRYADADQDFRCAADALRQAGSPLWRVALLERGTCAYYRSDYTASLGLLRQALDGLDIGRYPSIAGRIWWLQGLDHLVLRDLPASLRCHRLALAAFERLGEAQHAAFLHFLVAADLAGLGESRLAWQERGSALSALPKIDDIRRAHSVLWEAAQAALDDGANLAALFFLQELRDDPRLYRLPAALAEVAAYRGLLEQRLGLYESARSSLRRAATYAAVVGDLQLQARIAADVERFAAEASLATGGGDAARGLARALAFYEHKGFALDELALRLELAQADEQEGRYRLAAAELRRGIAAYLDTRRLLDSDIDKQHYASQVGALIGELLRVEGGRLRSPAAALAEVEATRARSLLDSLAAGPPSARALAAAEPMPLAEVQRHLDPQTALVEYAFNSRDLYIGVITAAAVSLTLVPGAMDRLQAPPATSQSSSYLRWLEDGYDLAVRPVLQRLSGVHNLVFIPDSNLAALPFAALRDHGSGFFLIERYVVQVTPSATLFFRSRARPAVSGGRHLSVLFVRGDAFDRTTFPELAPLGRSESAEMAQTGARIDALEGSRATRPAVLQRLDELPVLHFSAHALYRPDHPARSGVLLAPDEGDDGVLTAEDLQSAHLRRVRLVVLGACSTIAARDAGAEGIAGMARAFLAAGAPAVLATLTAVDDAATGLFLADFYRHLAGGSTFGAALRQAQLAAIAHPPPGGGAPFAWAQVEIIGGGR
jgi:hypothetical protein